MKILLIFTFYLIPGPVSCFDVIGYAGGIVVIYCRDKRFLYFMWLTDPCCSGPNTVAGYLGETVTISFLYPEEFERKTKYLFKQAGFTFTEVIRSTETQRGRFSISEDRSSSVLRLAVRDVREDDGGVYYCGVGFEGDSVGYYSLYTETQLQVTGEIQ
ncbi:hypothetical protein AOLI_G00233830 [Acnodon oligacanthus]